ncbi:diaminohydroxyphosphoribosylaminopyrimidine deaminase/5-amino-6-(5-phosphoribosylamino)uracil reductase [Acetoanaerobium pronyense]|uniref:Riboflavin biosynthesis protein RibD n=2 Tax=Acetoanaerobium pronyense TaxID=1482736 RepID=A0ABS4KG98_9FIRM|nr:diaminohydroxyphosphoribosylaminopyrimidine deaminase/5-amino-6-(5-phosphoribosylamino)uracil reductase [Acetoanaerobium pronyense]
MFKGVIAIDQIYMKRAIELAKKGEGYVNPNPLVGAVIVKDGKIIGEGFHRGYGKNHAEVDAFESLIESPIGATIYVNLEPCSHFGKTPPCANRIVAEGIKRVVIAMKDPNPLVSGNGIKILKENNIDVTVGVLEEEATKLNEIFIKYITTGIPFFIVKTAMTLDGKIASYTGDSKWITGELAREKVHKIRHRMSGIMVGIGTVLKDNPSLTTRLNMKDTMDPHRIIVDTSCRIPLDSKVLNLDSKSKTIIVTTENASDGKIKRIKDKGAEVIILPKVNGKVDLKALAIKLGEMKIDSVLIEGGSSLNYSAFDAQIVDKVMAFIAPKIIGGVEAKTPVGGDGIKLIKDSINISCLEATKIGDDILIEGYVRKD